MLKLTPEQEQRIEQLIAEMTLEEKAAQITSLSIVQLMENGKLSNAKMEEHLQYGIGQITRIAGAAELPPSETARLANAVQRFLVEQTRLGIPAIVHEECLSGLMARGATTFPQAISMAATWDPVVTEEMTTIIRQQARAVGAHQMLAPLADIARDPRWGRTEETFGEDPYLVSRLATAYVQGLQGDDLQRGVIATPKHFAGYGFPEGGRNCAPVRVGPREFREMFLFPFEVTVKEGQTLSMMTAYHQTDGVPASADRWLLTEVLREEWGFDGVLVADYGSISRLESVHHVAADAAEAAKLALEAGVDVELPNPYCYGDPLVNAVRQGNIDESFVDRSVRRHLSVKFALNLFDNPYVAADMAPEVFETAQQRQVALEAARRVITLLKNEGGLLPLARDLESIAVIGPNGDNTHSLLGCFSYTTHSRRDEDAVRIVSILEGIRSKVSRQTEVVYARGSNVMDTDTSGFDEAVQIASASDIIVAVVGGKSAVHENGTSGEFLDRAELGLPGAQEELLKKLHETGKPIVVVLVNGRPLAIEWLAENVPAIVEAWLPGEEGGNAVAEVVFGDYNPGGKLPVSLLRTAGQAPTTYNRQASSWSSGAKYVFTEREPLYPFGHGLSYTEFAYHNLQVSPQRVQGEEKIRISCQVQNTGDRAGDEVIQLYVHDPLASVTRPVKELKGFQRITLEPREKKTVTFAMPVEQLAFYDMNMDLIVEPGEFEVMVGSSSEDIRLEGTFELVEKREVGSRSRFLTAVEVT